MTRLSTVFCCFCSYFMLQGYPYFRISEKNIYASTLSLRFHCNIVFGNFDTPVLLSEHRSSALDAVGLLQSFIVFQFCSTHVCGIPSSSLVSEDVLAFLRCNNIDIYCVHKNVKFLRHLWAQSSRPIVSLQYMLISVGCIVAVDFGEK